VDSKVVLQVSQSRWKVALEVAVVRTELEVAVVVTVVEVVDIKVAAVVDPSRLG
jgi:hypothetical protein